jgi:RHS repeat-associated protein
VQNTTAWSYNSQDRVTQETVSSGSTALGARQFAYDTSGNLTRATDRNGAVRQFSVDSSGNVASETWYANATDADASQNAANTIQYGRDSAGRITSESDNSSSDSYVYNDAGQITSTTETTVGGPTVVLAYQYDTAGDRTQMAATIDGTADFVDDYTYNSAGEVASVHQHGVTGGDAVADVTVDLTYNDAGQVLTIDRYQGSQLAVEGDYSYDSLGRLVGLVYHQGDTVLNSYAWTYSGSSGTVASSQSSSGWMPTGGLMPVDDTSGVVAALTSGGLAGMDLLTSCTSIDGTANYSYDPTGQLLAASYTDGQASESYAWDANGNPAGSGDVVGPNNELLSDGTYTYTYDAEGNRTSKFIDANADGVLDSGDTAVTQYTWDARNRLVGVTNYATEGGPATQTVTYSYDAENRWVGENIETFDTTGDVLTNHETCFAYDGNQIVLEFDKDGSGDGAAADLSDRYVSGPAVDQVLADEQVTNLQTAGNVVWPLADNLGTIRDLAVYNAQSGVTSIANHRVYDSFGNLKSQTNAAVDCLFGFAGLPFDKGSGFDMSQTRPYDPATGRWAQPDWSGLDGGDTNLYRYCGNSPTNTTDPSGQLSLAQAIADGNLTVGKIMQLSLTDAEVQMLIQSAGTDAKFWTADNLDEYHRKEADKEYPDLTPSVRYWAEARQINQNEAKFILLSRNGAFQEYVARTYELLRGMNPPHYVAEKGFALGSGKEPVLGGKVNRLRTLADLILYMGTIKGADWIFGKVKGATLGSGRLTSEAADLGAFKLPSGGSLEVAPGVRPGMYSADQLETAITQANYGCEVTIGKQAITARFNATLKGPLPQSVVKDFTGGSYSQVTLGEDVILYRSYGGTSPKTSNWWTTTRPTGPLQSQMDSSLPPGNTATNVVKIRVPAGTVIYEGGTEAQFGRLGGGDQIYIDHVDPSWEAP